jgi:hypothetical protein
MYLIIPKMTPDEREEIHGKILEKFEMPAAWYSGAKKKADSGALRQKVLMELAETLLVYERLNAFYM